MTEDERSADYDETCGGCVAGTNPWHSHAETSDSRPASGASHRLHWHLVVRHKHPEWHGHCGDPFKRGWKPCGRTHWHGPFRHRHSKDGR